MTPGFQTSVSRLEGQWRNLFRRIRRIRRSAAIPCVGIPFAARCRSYGACLPLFVFPGHPG